MASTFNHFLQKFPTAKLPVTLSEEEASDFSMENEPIPHKLIEEYIVPLEEDHDEYTEYVPCLSIGGLKNLHAVVYWKAGLLNYQYILATFDKGGTPVDRRVLAGTVSDGHSIVRSVASIEDDMSIVIMSGLAATDNGVYDASESTTVELELLSDGRVVELG